MKFITATMALTLAAFAQSGQPPSAPTRQIAPNLYVIEAPLNGAEGPNLAFYVAPEGVIAIDDRIDQNHEYLVKRIKEITDKPLKYVVLTHHHGEHHGAYRKSLPEVRVVGHTNAAKHLRDAQMTPPQIIFADELSLFLGDTEVRLLHEGPAHTDGDLVVYFPAVRALYVGDLMSATETVTNPAMDYANGGSLKQWPTAIDRLLTLDFDKVIPGTGLGVTNKAALTTHRDKLRAIGQKTAAAIREKRSKDEISQMLVQTFSYKPINLRSVDGMMSELSK